MKPQKKEEVDVKIAAEDLKIDTFRSSGAGGLNVKKVTSCCPHHSFADRYCCYLPDRTQPETKQSYCHENPVFPDSGGATGETG